MVDKQAGSLKVEDSPSSSSKNIALRYDLQSITAENFIYSGRYVALLLLYAVDLVVNVPQ